ncbi:hypothetical protein [Pararhodobacter aggregans]|uniref:4-oxalocrotonate tautomerase n=1 Tax=Pararhodobacter aggregans TaxID=404875 RepID=A0A2T7UKU2_9RHOB|nr:hypothetical protein [Pararhodobacter aggregans]PTX02347.1 hypothetical protein C8N33_105166 [Pararhodobacter aggregans]PVE45293.1 hypothetical protein DDE23_22245 [Pararhodobacter aggregans]
MPNIKLYVDMQRHPEARGQMPALMAELRDIVVQTLGVQKAACQLAAIEVAGLADQPPVNLEMSYLPAPARTRDRMEQVAGLLRDAVRQATGLHSAVRFTALDGGTYLATK